MKFIGILLLHMLCISADGISLGHDSTEDLSSRLQRSPSMRSALLNSNNYQISQLTTKISQLSDNISSLNKIKTDIANINARTSRIEQSIYQRDENAKSDVQKIISTLEDTTDQLNKKFMYIENKLHMMNGTLFSTLSRMEYASSFNAPKINYREPIVRRPEQILKPEITDIQAHIIQDLSDRVNFVGAQIQELKTLLDMVIYRVEDVGHHLNKPKCNLTCNITPHCAMLSPVKDMMVNISHQIQQLSRVRDMHAIQHETRLRNNENLKFVLEKRINDLGNKLPPNRSNQNVGELRLCGINNASNINQNDFERLYTQLILMNSDIIDNNRKVDDGVQKILSEIGLLVKGETSNINTNLIRRFNGISNVIAKEEETIVSHLSVKMEQEINQVLDGINFIRDYIANVPKH